MKLSASPTKTLSRLGLRRRYALDPPLVAALLAGLALRLLLWGHIPRTGLISDEGEYLSAAGWLAHGHGFDWYQGYLWTRAPLYPLFLAAHLGFFGDSLAPIYATQTLLSLINVALVYFLARYLTDQRPTTNDQRPTTNDDDQATHHTQPFSAFSILHSSSFIPGLAALLMALYFPFALYAQTLLSETLFISLLLGGFLALARWVSGDQRPTTDDRRPTADPGGHSSDDPRPATDPGGHRGAALQVWVAAAGVLLGLATLTRSITLLFLPIVALWIFARSSTADRRPPNDAQRTPRNTQHAARHRFLAALVFLACAGTIILPWTAYNSRINRGLVLVDTSGAFNLLLGGRTAYDGDRDDAAARDYALVLLGQKDAADVEGTRMPCTGGFPAPLPDSQAARQGAMTREALCLIAAKPTAFAAKSLAELVDLFQINYTGAERFTNGFTTGRLPIAYIIGLFLLDDTLYILVLPLAIIGWALKLRMKNEELRNDVSLIETFSILHSSFFILVGLWWLYNIALAPLLFAINRFRMPLLPFAFIFAAYALAALARGGWRGLRSRSGLAWATLAAALTIVATAPYSYLWPSSESLPSYLGPYPSSLKSTSMAIAARDSYLRTDQLRQALHAGQADQARRLLASGEIKIERANRAATTAPALIAALLASRDGRPADGLSALPQLDAIVNAKDVEAAVVRGDLLRSMGRLDEARAAFGRSDKQHQTGFVDDANPVQWAWDWLQPAPLPNNHIDLAGDLDLGYIEGCYLGEGDPGQGTFRWCTNGMRLRFPGAGTGAPQMLALRADGRGWLPGWLPVPPVRVLVGGREAGAFTPSHDDVRVFAVALPPAPPGADVVVTLHTPTFIPDAARYLSQQGGQVGQMQRLGVRLDWAELRN
jgi:4-amino-4-deoxy-L-arabinose transferase-like glycosyltransferase